MVNVFLFTIYVGSVVIVLLDHKRQPLKMAKSRPNFSMQEGREQHPVDASEVLESDGFESHRNSLSFPFRKSQFTSTTPLACICSQIARVCAERPQNIARDDEREKTLTQNVECGKSLLVDGTQVCHSFSKLLSSFTLSRSPDSDTQVPPLVVP